MEHLSDKNHKEKIDLLSLDIDKLKSLKMMRNSDTIEDFYCIKQKVFETKQYVKRISDFMYNKKNINEHLPKTELFIFKDKTKLKEPASIPLQPFPILSNEPKSILFNKEIKSKEKEENVLKKEKLNLFEVKTEDEKVKDASTINIQSAIFKNQIQTQTTKESQKIIGIPKKEEKQIEPKKEDIKSILTQPPKTESQSNFNIFGALNKADKTKSKEDEKQSKIEDASAIKQDTIIQVKEEPKINQGTVVSTNEKVTVSQLLHREKIKKCADVYWNLRDVLKRISQNPKHKERTDKICCEINPIIDQISQEEDLDERINMINVLLNEIFNMKSKELYIFAINYICQRLILKSDKYRKEHKKIFITLAKFIYKISLENQLIQDYFIMMISYKCPYIIPITYSKQDFKDNYSYMKRLGYSSEKETVSDMINNMECYGYLYFAFLTCDNKFFPLIKEYIDCLDTITIDYPITTVYKTFLNTLGNLVKNKIPDYTDKLKKISEKILKVLNDLKANSKSSLLKSIAGENIHFIKLYIKNILAGVKTDMYD